MKTSSLCTRQKALGCCLGSLLVGNLFSPQLPLQSAGAAAVERDGQTFPEGNSLGSKSNSITRFVLKACRVRSCVN